MIGVEDATDLLEVAGEQSTVIWLIDDAGERRLMERDFIESQAKRIGMAANQIVQTRGFR